MAAICVTIILLVVLCISKIFAHNSDLDDCWNDYKTTFKKMYGSDEDSRRGIWEKNVNDINSHNLNYDMKKQSYRKGLNVYTDMDHDEFALHMFGYNPYKGTRPASRMYQATSDSNLPDFVDWRQRGLVTHVKDQSQCSACWAFVVTGTLEGQFKRKTGILTSLSEQNLIDCSLKEGNQGCKGGSMDQAYLYIMRNGGIDTEASYPYSAEAYSCDYAPQYAAASVSDYVKIPSGSEIALQNAVANIGPIAAGFNASPPSFQFYCSGIYDDPSCDSETLHHAVLVVGYGSEDGIDYWIFKNSWGTSWGENGYMRIARNKNNLCGIATDASYPLIQQ